MYQKFKKTVQCEMCNNKGGHFTEDLREFKIFDKIIRVPVWVPCLECSGDADNFIECKPCGDTHFIQVGPKSANLVKRCSCHPNVMYPGGRSEKINL